MTQKSKNPKRRYHNQKINAMFAVLHGKDFKAPLRLTVEEILKQREAMSLPPGSGLSLNLLTDKEAETLYSKLRDVVSKTTSIVSEAKAIVSPGELMNSRQKSKIIRLSKYVHGWNATELFKRIIESNPGIEETLSPGLLKSKSLKSLYKCLTVEQANKVIKRLEAIEKNKSKRNG